MPQFTAKVYKGKENFDDAFFIRKTVFMDEQGFFDEFDDIDSYSFHVVVYDADKPIGCGRIFPENDNAHLGRIAVLKEYRKQGIGRIIMEKLEQAARENLEFKRYELSAQKRAIGFYKSVGYEEIGEMYLDEGYPHITMVKGK